MNFIEPTLIESLPSGFWPEFQPSPRTGLFLSSLFALALAFREAWERPATSLSGRSAQAYIERGARFDCDGGAEAIRIRASLLSFPIRLPRPVPRTSPSSSPIFPGSDG